MITAQILLDADEEAGSSEQLVEEVGTLVFQSALMYYLASHNETETNLFENFVAQNAANESFMEDLCLEFPEFEQVLMAEMYAFQQEVLS